MSEWQAADGVPGSGYRVWKCNGRRGKLTVWPEDGGYNWAAMELLHHGGYNVLDTPYGGKYQGFTADRPAAQVRAEDALEQAVS